jgi:ATP/maltotriose-dependent transcriptional regulator MalT
VKLTLATEEKLKNDTQGWPFAVELAASTLLNLPYPVYNQPFAMKELMGQFIKREIVAKMSPDLVKLLVKIGLLDQSPVDLVSQIAEDDNLLGELERTGYFLRKDTYASLYTMHPLLREYFAGCRRQLSQEEISRVLEKTALWFAAHRHIIGAAEAWLKAGKPEKYAELVATLPVLISGRTAEKLYQLLEDVPAVWFEQVPELRLIQIRCLLSTARVAETLALVEAIKSPIESAHANDPDDSLITPMEATLLMGCYNVLGFLSMLTARDTEDYNFARFFRQALRY